MGVLGDLFFFFNDTATTEIYTLSLHDALPIRTATAGLAASDSTMPESISAMIAPSSGRSTVHHQSDNGLRSSRESMGQIPGAERVLPLAPMVVSKRLMDSRCF